MNEAVLNKFISTWNVADNHLPPTAHTCTWPITMLM